MKRRIIFTIILFFAIACSIQPAIELPMEFTSKLKRNSIYREYVKDLNNVVKHNSQKSLINLLTKYKFCDKYNSHIHGYIIVEIANLKGDAFLASCLTKINSDELSWISSYLNSYFFLDYSIFHKENLRENFKENYPISSKICGI